jgi:DNA processing protein
LDPPLQAIWDQLAQRRHIDELAYALQCRVSDLLPQLMQLELQHRIRRLPGNFYERTGP